MDSEGSGEVQVTNLRDDLRGEQRNQQRQQEEQAVRQKESPPAK